MTAGREPGAASPADRSGTNRNGGNRNGGNRNGTPDGVLLAWLIAGAVLVALLVYVVRHLSGGGHSMAMSDAVFRGDAAGTGRTLLGTRLVTAWQLNVVAVALVLLSAVGYLTGVRRRALRNPGGSWPIAYLVSFLLGLLVIVVATCGSIAVYDEALFSAHMLVHLSLVMVAPALIVLGHPVRLAADATAPTTAQRIRDVAGGRVVSLLTSPPVALACYTAVIVGTHLTGLMDVIMKYTWAGQAERVVYLAVGCQFFAAILGDPPLRWQLSTPIRWLLLAVAMAVDTFTGVVLMMSSQPISMRAPAGVGPMSDTRTGGAIMWFGGDAIMAVIMIALAISWLGQSGRSTRDRSSWLEQARAETLAGRTSIEASADPENDIDDDEAQRNAYNEWLAKISDSGVS